MEVKANYSLCPICYEGTIFTECPTCRGETCSCAVCGGVGEIGQDCLLCDTQGQVPTAFKLAYEAYQRIKGANPYWNEFDEPGGVTDYSLALYYRNRGNLRNSVLVAKMKHSHPEFDSYLVELHDERSLLVAFTGFAWGYRGEGSRGLATILADLFEDDFESIESALQEVCRHPMKSSWEWRFEK
jgi:hypothetical protein